MPVTNIRVLRVRTGKTMREFAGENGLSEVMLSRIEKGRQYVPPKWRNVLAGALGVAVEDICDPETGWPRVLAR